MRPKCENSDESVNNGLLHAVNFARKRTKTPFQSRALGVALILKKPVVQGLLHVGRAACTQGEKRAVETTAEPFLLRSWVSLAHLREPLNAAAIWLLASFDFLYLPS